MKQPRVTVVILLAAREAEELRCSYSKRGGISTATCVKKDNERGEKQNKHDALARARAQLDESCSFVTLVTVMAACMPMKGVLRRGGGVWAWARRRRGRQMAS